MTLFILGVLTVPLIIFLMATAEIFLVKSKRIRRLPTNILLKEKNLPIRHLFWRFFWKDGVLIIGSRVPTKEEKIFLKRG